jgi:hypothetical protein
MQVLLRAVLNGIGWCGALFVAYGVVAAYTVPWVPLERIATPLSSFLTVAATVLTAGSIFSSWALTSHVPDPVSRRVTAPAVIGAGCLALGVLLWKGSIPAVTVNGFALLGLSGGLLRLQPRPEDW